MAATSLPLDKLDKRADAIRDMFAGVAPRYDLLNRLLSARLDVVWRRRAAEALGGVGGPVLDLCSGTGDQALALRRQGRRVAAADFCLPMLALARRKYARLQGGQRPLGLAADALLLPFAAAHFAGATVAFGLRNVADLDQALRELARVLAPAGRLAVLEFALPRRAPLRALYLFYFQRLLPWIGRLVSGRRGAYAYLPASVLEFPQRRAFLDRLQAAGFDDLRCRELAAGVACLYEGRRTA
jgi:demethylmenaquinone methyltransferase/2-methoxy-6-polyprenyl-1,4-benzoquinol methylase